MLIRSLVVFAIALCALPVFAGTVKTSSAGPLHALTVDLTSLSLDSTSLHGVQTQCWQGTGFSAGEVTGILRPVKVISIDALTTSSITVNFRSDSQAFSNVVCAVTGGSGGGSVDLSGVPANAVLTKTGGVVAGDANLVFSGGKLNLGGVDPNSAGRLLVKADPSFDGSLILVGQQDSGDSAGYQLAYHIGYNAGSGSVDKLNDTYIDLENYGGGTVTIMTGPYTFGANDAGAHTGDFRGHYALFDNGNSSQLDGYYGFYNAGIHNHDGGHVDRAFGFWSDDMAGNADNPYYSWFDSRGVRRVKEDSTFDSVGQAIEALYNPQFTKYTPGAANFERVVLGQWNGNVAEIGNEKGGTGTLRPLRLLGTHVQIQVTTFATLATCAVGTEGSMKPVSDSSTATWGATITGGGANHVLGYCNGTNWTVAAK